MKATALDRISSEVDVVGLKKKRCDSCKERSSLVTRESGCSERLESLELRNATKIEEAVVQNRSGMRTDSDAACPVCGCALKADIAKKHLCTSRVRQAHGQEQEHKVGNRAIVAKDP
eukprot:5118490-Amphidinium_carterae.2